MERQKELDLIVEKLNEAMARSVDYSRRNFGAVVSDGSTTFVRDMLVVGDTSRVE